MNHQSRFDAGYRKLGAGALVCPGLEARFPAHRREERGCGPVTGKDRASCQSGGAPAVRPGEVAQSPGREAALAQLPPWTHELGNWEVSPVLMVGRGGDDNSESSQETELWS